MRLAAAPFVWMPTNSGEEADLALTGEANFLMFSGARTYQEHNPHGAVPLYLARIDDLGPGDFVKIDCAACSHTALLSTAFLSRLGLDPREKVRDLKNRVKCRGCGARGRAVVSIRWAKSVA